MQRLLIIDGNAIIHRAYHALPPMTTKAGVMVNAVYGFASMLLKVWRDLKPSHIAVTFDVAGGTFRHEQYKEYKATRVKADQALYDQIPLVHDLVTAFNLPIYEKKGYEADDVIGTIVKAVSNGKPRPETFVVTGDMDTLQLVARGVKIFTLRKGLSDTVIYDDDEVKKRYGFGPELIIDYKALRGDASDNIPGVPGIGEKTATELIQKVGSLDQIYKKLNKLSDLGFTKSVVKKLEQGKDSATMSRELATIECAVPDIGFKLEDCAVGSFDREQIVKLFQKLEFTSLLKRLPGATDAPLAAEKKSNAKNAIPRTENFSFTEAKTEDELAGLIKKIKEIKKYSCQAIWQGQTVFAGALKGFVLTVGQDGFYAPIKIAGRLRGLMEETTVEVAGHDLKQLVKICRQSFGADIRNKLFDVMVASYLLSPGSRSHDAASVVLKALGKELVAGGGQENLFGLDTRTIAYELLLITSAGEILRRELAKVDNQGLFEKVEMPLIRVLAEMELNGVALDDAVLAALSGRVSEEIKKVSARIYGMAGQEFNIGSPIQLREVLFDKLQIPVEGIKKGKTGLSTSAEQLEKMHGLHPIIDEIESFRELAKLQNTYIDVLPKLVDPKTKRVHTTFNQTVAATGRLSSSDPNLQNIPIRTELGREIRNAFIAEPGNVLLSADYSQIELRIVASLAEDKRMMEIFAKGEDIHQATAAAINGVPLDKVTKEMRRAAKEVNFGVLYGMGTYGLSWRADISHAEAAAFIEKYFREFSGVKKHIDETLAFTKKEGYCETLFGRRRYLPELQSSNYQLRAAAERMAINHPIQGTAADLMKMGMINVSERLATQAEKLEFPKLTLQVHDELVLEVKAAVAEKIARLVKEIMETVAVLRVPIEVHVSQGNSWGKMEKLDL